MSTTPARSTNARLVRTAHPPRPREEVVERVTDLGGTFEIGEVSAVFQRYQTSFRNCLRDVGGDLARDEVVIAGDDQRRDIQGTQLGQQIVPVHLPGIARQPVLDGFTMPSAPWLMNAAFTAAISFS